MRRFKGRRRGPSLRWFTPNNWNTAQPVVVNTQANWQAGNALFISDTAMLPLLKGSAPFPGVTNAAGRLAGTQLAERQYWRLKRIVGRLEFYMNFSEEAVFSQGLTFRVHWAVVRWHTDDGGAPDTPFIDLSLRDDQDEKPVIIYQDTWTTDYPVGTSLSGAPAVHPLSSDPPLYNYIDIRTGRPFRNEQDLFLATQFTAYDHGSIVPQRDVEMQAHINLRLLGTFGR